MSPFLDWLVYLAVGVVFLLVAPRLVLAWGMLTRRLATSLLGRMEPLEMKFAVIEALKRMGEADGFRILDELELRLGRGPFLTSTRLEATLLALESAGQVIITGSDGNRAIYTFV